MFKRSLFCASAALVNQVAASGQVLENMTEIEQVDESATASIGLSKHTTALYSELIDLVKHRHPEHKNESL